MVGLRLFVATAAVHAAHHHDHHQRAGQYEQQWDDEPKPGYCDQGNDTLLSVQGGKILEQLTDADPHPRVVADEPDVARLVDEYEGVVGGVAVHTDA